MKSETSFLELDQGLIVVSVVVTGPARKANARFVLDTGAAVTTITPRMAAFVGYSARDGLKRTTVRTAIGSESGYVVRTVELAALGFATPRLPVHVFDLGDMHIHGLLGMNFLSSFNYEIRSAEHRILAEKIAA
jgi:clan AA aspartic protease (TIGR02281 family)